ncbi:MAG: transglutaminase-like domain-containing protein [Odoribacter sp.]|nr:transglutaminase-like domain-containing protein [Odoribacter sp.]MDY3033386.1 transglutaminase-like domain-containing protein [Odoribacter sp.]
MKYILLFVALCCFACTGGKYAGVPEKYHVLLDKAFEKAGNNAVELEKALKDAPENQKEGMAFLIAYMPERDLQSLKADFLLENAAYAYQAREQFPWAKAIPDSIFLNEVLPYVSLNEKRESWRKEFYERFSKYVAKCTNIFEAIDSVNRNIRDEVVVDYNTKREKPDQAPFESMRQHMASCTGLSILLTDAFRAVGIPSRVAGTPNWHDERGNHNWTEVWADGKWYFTEYYFPGQLDNAWFFADAGQAVKNNPDKAIYASSFKPTGISFPLVWDENIRYVYAENVTDRYTDLYQKHYSAIAKDGDHVALRVTAFKDKKHDKQSEDRVATNLDVFHGKLQMGGGRTAGPTQDMNDVLTFMLKKNQTYTVNYVSATGMKSVEVKLKEKTKELKLYME